MKTIIVYYSLEGNCALIADSLKTALGAEALEIKTQNDKKRSKKGLFFWGLFQMIFNRRPALKTFEFDVNAWDLIILGTPVWGGEPAPAMRSFLDKVDISGKKIALFCCHAGGMGKTMNILKGLLHGNTITTQIDFKSPSKAESTELKRKIDEWVKVIHDIPYSAPVS